MVTRKIAVIGSFRQHYKNILEVLSAFKSNGHLVTTPLGATIIEEGIPFVRFESDSENLDDCCVQSIALHRILRADLVYVVAPDGYVGRTTCYEIGRVIQAMHPIYFSAQLEDLPVRIPSERIYPPAVFSAIVSEPCWSPTPIFHEISHPNDEIEKDLLYGIYRED